MKNYKAGSVDEYIASAPVEAQSKLKEVRQVIKSTIPGAEEKISWGIPFYRYRSPLVGFASFARHVSFGLGLSGLSSEDRKTLEEQGYKTGSKIVQIRFDQKVPTAEMQRILLAQAEMNEQGVAKNSK